MVISRSTLELISIIYGILALLGAYIAAFTAYNYGTKMDNTLVKARAFLSESFLKDNWTLLFLACILFLIHTAMELNGIFELFIVEDTSELIEELTELGIGTCIFMLVYKWFRLMSPSGQLEAGNK